MTAILLAAFLLLFTDNAAARYADDFYYTDKPERAIKYYEDRIKEDKFNRMHYFHLASVCKEFGENRKAFNAYREILHINDREVRAHFELAKVYYFLGAHTYGQEEIKYLARSGRINWEVYYWWGCMLFEQGKLDEAEEKFNKAMDDDPRKVIIYIKLAELKREKGDIDSAISLYKKALKKDRTYTELNKKIAYLYEKKKDFVEAFSYWKKTGEIDTKDKKAREKVQKYAKYFPRIKEKIEEYKEDKKQEREAYNPPDKKKIDHKGTIPVIEVGLVEDVRTIYFKSGSDFEVFDHKNRSIMKGEKLKQYYITLSKSKKTAYIGNGNKKKSFKKHINIRKKKKEATTAIYNVQYGEGFYWSSKKDMTYRGDFKIILSKKKLTLVNLINVEEYLYGVIPAEMPASWEMEALKTQAIAARTYTFKHLGRHAKDGFDLCAQQHCAVYKGVNGEHEKTNRAVDATRGLVVYGSNYKMLNTFYSHCCGGHTVDVSEVWGMRKLSSLSGVYDGRKSSWRFPLYPFYLEEWVRTVPDTYCKVEGKNEVSFRWIRYLDAESLEHFVNKRYKIGRIKKLKPIKRAKGGALAKIYIEGDKGKKTVKFDPMRNILGKIRSNVIKWEYRVDSDGYIKDIYIYGAGWGHSVGMCQRGANGMAKEGKTARQILYHYFPGSYVKEKY